MEIKTESIINILKLLSWGKIAQLVSVLVIVVVSLMFWENRVVVYNSLRVTAKVEVDSPLVLELSNDTRQYIDTAVNKSTLISGIQIVSVDFKKNSRMTSYFSTDSDDLLESYNTFLKNKISPTPLFTSNESQNQRVIELINGEFSCKDVKETIAASLLQDLDKSTKVICSISVPPYYGRFSGYLNMYLSRVPSSVEIVTMKQISRDVSLRIYEIDIDKSAKYKAN